MKLVKLYVVVSVIFLILDGIWLGFIANQFYIKYLHPILRLKNNAIDANLWAALIVYIALISGIVFLVMPLSEGVPSKALAIGIFYGFVTYATYDFTNLAVLKDWSWTVAGIDLVWGMVLCGLSSWLACLIVR